MGSRIWGLGFQFKGFGFWILGSGVWGLGFGIQGFRFQVSGLESGVETIGVGFQVEGLEFGVETFGLGFQVQGLEFGVETMSWRARKSQTPHSVGNFMFPDVSCVHGMPRQSHDPDSFMVASEWKERFWPEHT